MLPLFSNTRKYLRKFYTKVNIETSDSKICAECDFPRSEERYKFAFHLPTFTDYDSKPIIEQYSIAFQKIVANMELIKDKLSSK